MVIRLKCLSLVFGLLICGSLYGSSLDRSLLKAVETQGWVSKTRHLENATWHGLVPAPGTSIENSSKVLLVSLRMSHTSTAWLSSPWESIKSLVAGPQPDQVELIIKRVEVSEDPDRKDFLQRAETRYSGTCERQRTKNRYTLVCDSDDGAQPIEIQATHVPVVHAHFQNAAECAEFTDLAIVAGGILKDLERLLELDEDEGFADDLEIPMTMTSARDWYHLHNFGPQVLSFIDGVPILGDLWRHLPYPEYKPSAASEGATVASVAAGEGGEGAAAVIAARADADAGATADRAGEGTGLTASAACDAEGAGDSKLSARDQVALAAMAEADAQADVARREPTGYLAAAYRAVGLSGSASAGTGGPGEGEDDSDQASDDPAAAGEDDDGGDGDENWSWLHTRVAAVESLLEDAQKDRDKIKAQQLDVRVGEVTDGSERDPEAESRHSKGPEDLRAAQEKVDELQSLLNDLVVRRRVALDAAIAEKRKEKKMAAAVSTVTESGGHRDAGDPEGDEAAASADGDEGDSNLAEDASVSEKDDDADIGDDPKEKQQLKKKKKKKKKK